ncbi:hypothetical protein EGW08_002687, partial [Elysia chlorotica]
RCVSCPAGRYGNTCENSCSTNCGGPGKNCHRVSGACDLCPAGFKGTECDKVCDAGLYGQNCSVNCSDHCRGNHSLCDHVNGTCDQGCDPGYQGALCTQICAKGTWGLDCKEDCNAECLNKTCDHNTGHCDCEPGYQGLKCDKECNATTYGAGCLEMCSEDCEGQLCHHVTGHCDLCPVGRTGSSCETVMQQQVDGGGDDAPIGAVVGGVFAALVIIVVAAAAVILWRRRARKSNDKHLAENGEAAGSQYANIGARWERSRDYTSRTGSEAAAPPPALDASNSGFQDAGEDDEDNTYGNVLTGNTALPVETLKAYILKHSTDSHLKDEFSSIPMATSSSQAVGLAEDNAKKNRFKNIIPYDVSRVLLGADGSKDQSDYINASFVKGFTEEEIFIASQGPNDLMLDDFVRMIWEQKVTKIVMLTNLIEQGKKKCSMYWPSEGEEEYKEVTVGLLTTHVFAEYTIRHLKLSKSGEPFRDVTQFHFTAWPDKSVPESPWGLVDFHQRVMSVPGSGPVLVHCSAGVGRTGTFIGLCNLLREAEVTGKMDFRSTLWKLRQDRMHTIQTASQYAFLHKAALVGHTIAGTTIQVKDIPHKLESLDSVKGDSKNSHSFSQEFEAVVEVCAATVTQPGEAATKPEDSHSSPSDTNKEKNRLSNVLSNPAYRPVLMAEAHREDTYINAVFVP